MIDVKKELEKYKPLGLGEDIKYDDDIPNLLYSFNRTAERIGKDQYRYFKYMDDIIEAVEDKRGYEKLIKDLEDRINSMDGQKESMLEVMIEIADFTENIYVYSLRSQDENFKNQMELQWKTLQQSLLKCGIKRFGNTGDIFDSRLHIAVEARECPDFHDGQIVDIIKSGYIFEDRLLRRVEASVNRTRPVNL